jgi:prolipoprotein diacylglyceryl transferase
MALVGFIPSPSSGSISIGPLDLRAYGLMIALGVIAAVWLWGRRLERNDIAPRDEASAIALWAVPAGIIGARLYHVATDWERFSDDLGAIPQIWKGGLGIPGGVLLGVIVGIIVTKRRGLDVPTVVWAAVPAIPLAQSIGRWGNWFNQELFGRPTDVAWALEIDLEHRPAGFEQFETFHPTFLYESLWNLALCGVLIVVGRAMLRHRPWRLLACYTLGYGIGRWWIEGLRIDAAKEAGGWRLNQWMAAVLIVGSVLYLVIDVIRHGRARDAVQTPTEGDDRAADDGPADDGPADDGSAEVADGGGEFLGDDGVEELSGSDLGSGDEAGDTGASPR